MELDLDWNSEYAWTLLIIMLFYGWGIPIPDSTKEELKRYAELAGMSKQLQELEDKKPLG